MPPKKLAQAKSAGAEAGLKRKADEDLAAPATKKVDTKASPVKIVPVTKAEPQPKKPVEIKVLNDYATHHRATGGDFVKETQLFSQVVDEENHFREVFAQDRNSNVLDDPYLMLVDVHKNEDLFVYAQETPEEAALPKVFPLGEARQPAGKPCVVSKKDFERNLDIFSEFQLRYLNWDNVFLAGGTALACLKPLPGEHGKDNTSRRNYFHRLAYKSSDVDLFIYGLDQEQANKKLQEVYEAVKESMPANAIAFRSTHAITIISQFPYRHIQIVLRLYKSPAEILMGFDVDACSVGYDGKSVWMTPRCHRALTHQYNVIDMSRRSPSYEMRLAKYSERGFAVLVPSLDRNRIDPQLFERRFDQLQGLAKLLLLESLQTAQARTTYKEQQRLRKLRPTGNQRASFWTALDPRFNDDFSRERLEAEGGADASDYSTVFLPWGPNWTAEKIRKMMYTKDMILNSKWYDPKKKHHTHPCFFGTINEIVKDCCGHCPPVPSKEEQEIIETMFVAGPVSWVTVNPGSQTARIGSFHPITEGDWTEGAYVSPNTEIMCSAITRNDVATVIACLDAGVDINGADPVGRTPLHIAAFVGAVDVAKELIARKARISKRTSEGRTALMIAAQYGHASIIKLLLERGKQLAIENEAILAQQALDKTKKKGKSAAPKKKKKGSDDEMDEEEDEGEGEEDEEMDEEGEGDEDGDGDGGDDDEEIDEFDSIKAQIEAKKRSQQLADEAADPSAKGDDDLDKLDIEDTDWDFKMTALHFAIFFGKTDAVQLLVEHGFSADRQLHYVGSAGNKIKTYSCLHLALINNHVSLMELLLKLGASINQLDLGSETVLHKAASMLNLDAMVTLVEWNGPTKVDINAFDSHARTPLVCALNASKDQKHLFDEKGNRKSVDPCSDEKFEVIEYIISVGAKVSFTEADLPASHANGQPGFGGFGGNQKAQSKRTLFRNFLNDNMPLLIATKQGSPRLVKLLLDNKVDHKFPMRTMPLDYIDSAITNLKGQLNPIDPAIQKYVDFLKKNRPKNKSSYEYFEYHIFKSNYGDGSGVRRRKGIPTKVQKNKSTKSTKSQQDEQKKFVQYQLKLAQEVQTLLKNAGSLPLNAMKLTAADDDLKHINKNSHWAPWKPTPPELKKPTVVFNAVPEAIPGLSYRAVSAYQADYQANYNKFFGAIWDGDSSVVQTLCVKPKVGKQTHVACFSGTSQLSSLMLAFRKKDPNMVETLLDICQKQFTPVQAPAAVESEKTRALNNYELSALMDRIKPGQFLNATGTSVHQQHETIDPNAPKVELNCVTSPASFIGWQSQTSRCNILHVAARYPGSEKSLIVLLDWIEKNNIKPHKYNLAENNKLGKQNTLLQDLLVAKNNKNLTPFESALAHGNIPVAKILMERGALFATKAGEMGDDEDEYQGLDVGGKKMDWALDHRPTVEKASTNIAVHIAATYNQGSVLTFLLTEGVDLYKKVTSNSDIPNHLSLDAVDSVSGSTVYHCLIGANQDKCCDTLKKLIGRDANKVFDKPNQQGMTPLHLAAAQGSHQVVKILMDAGAQLSCMDVNRGWTPLHFAATSSGENSVETVTFLLSSPSIDANVKSLTFEQTPLICAVHYGRVENVKAMLKSKKCDLNAVDACGEQAMQHAIKKGHTALVELFNDEAKNLEQESGLGLNALDTSMAMLLEPFIRNRQDNATDAEQNSNQLSIFGVISKKVSTQQRKLCELTEVNRFSRIMIERTNIITEKQTKNLTRHRRRYYNEEATGTDCHTLAGITSLNATELSFSESSEESEEEDDQMDTDDEAPTSLKGMTIALSGTLSMKRADVVALIKKHGGVYATSVTKAVTHLVVDDPNDTSSKITSAKADGKKIVSEKFFSNLS